MLYCFLVDFFQLSNEAMLACSTPLLQHLVSFLLCASENSWSGAIPEVTSLALDTLVNIGAKVQLYIANSLIVLNFFFVPINVEVVYVVVVITLLCTVIVIVFWFI